MKKNLLWILLLVMLFGVQSIAQVFTIVKTDVEEFPNIAIDINIKSLDDYKKSNFRLLEQDADLDFEVTSIASISRASQQKNILILVERFDLDRIKYFKETLKKSIPVFVVNGDKVNIAVFDVIRDNGNQTIFPLLNDYTDNIDTLNTAINNIKRKRDKYIKTSKGNNPKDILLDLNQAIYEGLETLKSNFSSNTILIVLSAGRNNNAGTMKVPTIKQYAITNNIPIYSIQYFINGYGNTNLSDIAEETSGDAFSGRAVDKSSTNLIAYMKAAVVKNIGKNYRLTYQSSFIGDGTAQNLKVFVNDKMKSFFINTPDLSKLTTIDTTVMEVPKLSFFENLWNQYKYYILGIISLIALGIIIFALAFINQDNDNNRAIHKKQNLDFNSNISALDQTRIDSKPIENDYSKEKSVDIIGKMKLIGQLPILAYKISGKMKHFCMNKPTISIGKSQKSDIKILDNKVQDVHAYIYFDNDKYRIKNANQDCITFVKGQRIERSIILHHGDRILIGNTEIIFKI